MPLASKLKKVGAPLPLRPRSSPVWEGPESDGPNGGITYSLLCRFLSCRERYRLLVVEGLKASEGWNHRIGYGDMWHRCEEAHAAREDWVQALRSHCSAECSRHPMQQQLIDHWYNVCKVQFPLYVEHWARHRDVQERTPLLQEEPFNVPLRLPSGRTVRLRGKWDSVDLIGKGKGAGIYVQENKTKSDIDEGRIKRQLTFDAQTMIYLVALGESKQATERWKKDPSMNGMTAPRFEAFSKHSSAPILGVRYNVVRRPLSGGRGTIKRHEATKGAKCPTCKGSGALTAAQAEKVYLGGGAGMKCLKCKGSGRVGAKPEESKADFYRRVGEYIKAEPEAYFMRWKVEVSPADVARFRRECLDPILENLCDWWDFISQCVGNPWLDLAGESPGIHWRHPFGCYNSLDEGYASDLDNYLDAGSTVGLQRVETMFPELQ